MEFPLSLAGPLDLTDYIHGGDTVLVGQATSEPQTLTRWLVEQRADFGGITVFLGAMFSDTFQPEHADHLHFTGIGGIGTNAVLGRAGILDVVPSHVSMLPALIESGRLPVDVVLVQVAPPDERGLHSLATVGDYLPAAISRARTVIAEINDQLPRTCGPDAVNPSRIDVAIRTSRPAVTVPGRRAAPAEDAIAALIEPLVPDGAVLQLGVGGVPQAVAGRLLTKSDLSVHSGVVGDWIVDLQEAGVVTNARKPIDTGVTVTGGLFGTTTLFGFADDNPAIELRSISYTHNPAVLRQLPGLIAMNSAIEVDLSGQVNAEVVGGAYVGAVGGQVDFVRAAMASPGGRSIIALPSTARKGSASRIVAMLSENPVTTARSDADLFVTEYGVADVRGLSLRRRAEVLIEVAHPDFREDLRAQMRGRRTMT